MRLIDADALKKDIMSYKTMPEIRKAICEVIDNAPAFETYTKDDMTREYLKGYNACKDMNERPQGDLISRSKVIEELNYLKYIGYDNSGVMKLQNMEIQRCISVIEDAPTVKPCDNCDLYFKAMTKEEIRKGGAE